jgi:hypothetical protein
VIVILNCLLPFSIVRFFSDIGEFNLKKPPTRTSQCLFLFLSLFSFHSYLIIIPEFSHVLGTREAIFLNEFQSSSLSKYYFFKTQDSKSLSSVLHEYSTQVRAIKGNISTSLMSSAQNEIYFELSSSNATSSFYSPPKVRFAVLFVIFLLTTLGRKRKDCFPFSKAICPLRDFVSPTSIYCRVGSERN